MRLVYISVVAFSILACSKDEGKDKPKAEVSEVVEPTATAASTAGSTPTSSNPAPPSTNDSGASDAAPAASAEEAYVLTPANTKVAFTGQKVGGNHNGSFQKFTGNLVLLSATLEQSKVDLEIETTSLKTDSAKLDAHLKSGDFFDVAKFPKARFKSVSLKPIDAKNATHTLSGVMEIKGIKRTMSFPVKISVNDEAVTAKADFVLSRKAFKIDFDGAADYLIKDDVPMSLSINLPRKK